MRKNIYLVLSIFAIILLTGCENTKEQVLENNNETHQENIQQNSKIICKGPMVGGELASLDDVITSDDMKIVAEFDNDKKLVSLSYIYEIDYAVQIMGDELDELTSSMKSICNNKDFISCDSDVNSQRAIVEAEADVSDLKDNYSPEKFKDEMKSLGDDFHCFDE